MKNIEKLNTLIREYQSIRELAQEAKANQDAIAGRIKELMEIEGLTEYFGETGKAVYKEVVSHPIDTAMLKRELPELAARYEIERTTRPLKVS